MRDLNLGPDTRKLIKRYQETSDQKLGDYFAAEMAKMLERWMTISWCWPDNCPAQICSGPHVRVKYQHDKMGSDPRPIEVIEPYNHIGERFPGVPYTIIKDDNT